MELVFVRMKELIRHVGRTCVNLTRRVIRGHKSPGVLIRETRLIEGSMDERMDPRARRKSDVDFHKCLFPLCDACASE